MTNSSAAAEPLPFVYSGKQTAEIRGCVSVIIPVFNEAGSIARLIQLVSETLVPKEIVVIDDGSTDGTREVLAECQELFEIRLVVHEENRGKGAAIVSGLEHARGEFVLIQDADLEYDPQDYPALLEPLRLRQTNVVYGVRPDRPERGLSWYLGAKFLTRLANFLYGCNIQDEATCYKAFRRSTLSRIRLKCRRFEFCPEVTAKMSRIGEDIWEVPISYYPRTTKEGKKIRWTDGVQAIWTLLRYRIEPRNRFIAADRFLKKPKSKPHNGEEHALPLISADKRR